MRKLIQISSIYGKQMLDFTFDLDHVREALKVLIIKNKETRKVIYNILLPPLSSGHPAVFQSDTQSELIRTASRFFFAQFV